MFLALLISSGISAINYYKDCGTSYDKLRPSYNSFTFSIGPDSPICIDATATSSGDPSGFVFYGSDLSLRGSDGVVHTNAFGGSYDKFVITSTKTQEIRIYSFYAPVMGSELILNTYHEWDGAVTAKISRDGDKREYNIQEMIFFTPNSAHIKVDIKRDSLCVADAEEEKTNDYEMLGSRFSQIRAVPAGVTDEDVQKDSFEYIAKVTVSYDESSSDLPEKTILINTNYPYEPAVYDANSPNFEVKDYAGYVMLEDGEIVAITIAVVIVVAIIVFCIVWFVVLKKTYLCCCKCPCCKQEKSSKSSSSSSSSSKKH